MGRLQIAATVCHEHLRSWRTSRAFFVGRCCFLARRCCFEGSATGRAFRQTEGDAANMEGEEMLNSTRLASSNVLLQFARAVSLRAHQRNRAAHIPVAAPLRPLQNQHSARALSDHARTRAGSARSHWPFGLLFNDCMNNISANSTHKLVALNVPPAPQQSLAPHSSSVSFQPRPLYHQHHASVWLAPSDLRRHLA